jgi:manganese-transporting P-type ATPase
MALQCLISSFSLSVLYLDGVKFGDTQMTLMGVLGSVSFMSVSRSKPLDKLSSVQPLSSIFHPASFISLLGQFAIHLLTMVVAVQSAKSYLPPDYQAELDGQFTPGILNTVVFLVSNVQQVTVFFVNIQGRPFMTGITENRPLLWSLAGTFILTFMFASESVPQMNRYFQLVPFPNEGFRSFILTILVMDLMGTFAFDRLMKFFFARDILMAGVQGTRGKDVMVFARTFAIIGFLMYQFLGNAETWDNLIAMEEELLNRINGTDAVENATECIEGVCEAVKDAVAKTVSSSLGDEF